MMSGLSDQDSVFAHADSAQVEELCQMLIRMQGRLQHRLAALEQSATNVARCNAESRDLRSLPTKVRLIWSDFCAICEHEHHVVFPIIQRLQHKTVISPCHAGMIAARTKIVMRQQDSLAAAIREVREIAASELSPAGPCETCHEFLQLLTKFEADFARCLRDERTLLLQPAMDRERVLSRRHD